MGKGEGLLFYRCELCHRAVSIWDINKGGCPRCGGTRIRPTTLTFFEKVIQIVRHPRIWEWTNVS